MRCAWHGNYTRTKPVRAQREIGLAADVPADDPTTEGIIAALAAALIKAGFHLEFEVRCWSQSRILSAIRTRIGGTSPFLHTLLTNPSGRCRNQMEVYPCD